MNSNQELDIIIQEVRRELRSILIKRKQLIERLGLAFERVVSNPESICEEIKTCLREEIATGLISGRTIEQACRCEWKKKTKPVFENEKNSFSNNKSESDERQIDVTIDTQGKPVHVTTKKSPDYDNGSRSYQGDNQLLQRFNRTIRELLDENIRIRQDKDALQHRLGEALQILDAQKEKENELVRKIEIATTIPQPHDIVFDVEFYVEYRPLQDYMKEIYRSATRQEVWFTTKINSINKSVVSVQIGKKSIQQNVGCR